jgi:hypothetical protein
MKAIADRIKVGIIIFFLVQLQTQLQLQSHLQLHLGQQGQYVSQQESSSKFLRGFLLDGELIKNLFNFI